MNILQPPAFTSLMLIMILSFAALTKSNAGQLPEEWLSRMGFAPKDIWLQKFENIFLSAFITDSRRAFIQALIMIFLCVGGLELVSTTWTTMLYFWGIHVLTLFFVTLFIIRPFEKTGHALGQSLYLSKDVGPSAGYFGCMGVLIHSFFGAGISWVIFFVILIGMMIYLRMPVSKEKKMMKLHADLAHMVALSMGFLIHFFTSV